MGALPANPEYLAPCSWPDANRVPPEVLFICGYKRTGKDTLARMISSGIGCREAASTRESSFRWEAFAPSGASRPLDRLESFVGAEVVAFGDALRAAVYEALRLPPTLDYETNKDIPLFAGRTIRDHMIRIGDLGRAVDKGHWVKLAFSKHFRPAGSAPKKLVCSDFRFRAEHAAAASAGITGLTIRLFRSAVPVPPGDISSEHDLDNFATDLLLLGASEDPMILPAALAWGRSYCGLGSWPM